eukprot:scaffold2.g7407.t1
MALIPRSLEQEFFSPFLSSDPLWGALQALTAPISAPSGGELASRGVPVDLVELMCRLPPSEQHENGFELKADIPGVEKSDIKVTGKCRQLAAARQPLLDKDILRIKVDKSTEKEEKKEEAGRKWHRYERSSTFVGRALRMPESADMEKVRAKYENGMLVLDIPKKPEAKAEAKRIDVA